MLVEILTKNETISPNQVVKIPGDGSCLFHSICYLVHGHTRLSYYIRQAVVSHVLADWERFKVWTDDGKGDNYVSEEHYRYEMLKTATYGSACELKAASELFPYCFEVYRYGKLFYTFGEQEKPVKKLRFSGENLSNGHFDVYVHAESPMPDPKLMTEPLVNLAEIIDHKRKIVYEITVNKNKRTRRSGKFSDKARKKQLCKASAKYAKNKPQCHRKAVAKYTVNNPNVNREAVSKYTKKNPEVNISAVANYTQQHPEVNRGAVAKYTQKHPDVHRGAVAKYTQQHPEINRGAVAKYTQKHPDVHRGAVAKYTQQHPEINRASVSRYDPLHKKRLERKKAVWQKKANSGFKYIPEIDYGSNKTISIGTMDAVCGFCNALKWKDESPGMCCSVGKVRLPPFSELPEPLNSLLVGEHFESEHFLNNTRKYNSSFQMTSFGAKQVVEGDFMPTFKVQGQVYHLIGSLLPAPQETHKFLQIYFVGDEDQEANMRCEFFSGAKPTLIRQLQRMFHSCNNYIKQFKSAIENIPMDEQHFKVVIHAERKPPEAHKGRFNAPSVKEVAVLIVGQMFEKRDIVLQGRDNKLKRVNEIHRAYDALQYPLMFCHGEDGYSISLPQVDAATKQHLSKTVSAANFYSYRLMVRQSHKNHLLLYRNLLNQYLVDMYAKIETERLNYIRNSQKKLRVENYIHLKDAVNRNDSDTRELGQPVILPSSFTGGPRYMHERTQDAMTYVRHYGRPDLFITFTCNPNWSEITEELVYSQKPQHRHDLIARVFHLKVKKMMSLLTKWDLFGRTRCFMYSVEWQKRGLPHIHILLWLENTLTPDKIDDVICAEIPNPQQDPLLFEIVKNNMIHGPCGHLNRKSPCMSEGGCSKKYPRPLLSNTQTGDDGYPKYRRRSPNEGGNTILFEKRSGDIKVDNSWVVPFNPVLLRTFNAHINVEYCNSVKSIKYICKYVNKGSDQATFALENNNDEIQIYQTGRYISSSEAIWRILGFSIHERFPSVMHLAVHLENGQRVYFTSDKLIDKINNPPNTTLLGFFELCKTDDFAKTLLYNEVPSYYIWKKDKFVRRKQGNRVEGHDVIRKDKVLGRVYTVHPNNSECYHLRLLLHEVRGPSSFSALKTVDGIVHPTFQSACKALGLLEDDSHWDKTLEEAALSDSPAKLRELLAIMLVFCHVSEPLILWEKHKDSIAEDIMRQLQRQFPDIDLQMKEEAYNRTLILIEDIVMKLGSQSLKLYGLPEAVRSEECFNNIDYLREISYDVKALLQVVSSKETSLTKDQRNVYLAVVQSVESRCGRVFFLDAPGGTGKTHLINLLLAKVRSNRKIALGVASSGIAATLLEGGRTAHAAFKLPLNLNKIETPMCSISKQSNTAQVLRDCQLIVWDECTMSHKAGIEALNRTLQDLRNNNRLMGGVTVLFAGDFRQTLPVIPRGTRADEVNSCLKFSFLWQKIEKLSLSTNMRVYLMGDNKEGEFADLLVKIGDGRLNDTISSMNIPKKLCKMVDTVDDLIAEIYPDIKNLRKNPVTWFSERALLTPTNASVAQLNQKLLRCFEGEEVLYKSVDSVLNSDEAVKYTVEFLNTQNPPGLPAHCLALKVGAPVMLLRNLNPPKLCNGTRLLIKTLRPNIIEATVFTGCAVGETVFIPRIPIIPSDYVFEFKRLQFPLKLCFAMTINKSQGQTLSMAGIDLREGCFSHGQFYVACSRVSKPCNLVILAPKGNTTNIVYREVLCNQ